MFVIYLTHLFVLTTFKSLVMKYFFSSNMAQFKISYQQETKLPKWKINLFISAILVLVSPIWINIMQSNLIYEAAFLWSNSINSTKIKIKLKKLNKILK